MNQKQKNNSELILTILLGWLGVHKFIEKEYLICYILNYRICIT